MESQNCCQKGKTTSQVAIVMVPLPAQGHLNQLLHLSHVIISYGLPVHYAGSATHNRQAKLRLQGWDLETSRKIEFHDLPLPPYNSPPPNPNSFTRFPAHLQPLLEATTYLREPMSKLLQDLSTKYRRIVIIHDSIMSSVIQDAKFIPNAETYSFIPFPVFYIFMSIWESLPQKPFELDPDIPSLIPSNEHCLTPEYRNFLRTQRKFQNFQSGRLFNSSRVIEDRYLELLERLPDNAGIKTFAIGPFHPMEIKSKSKKQRDICLEWLDKQEVDSVIYVSFGSIVTMSDEQIRELAEGLEKSRQKFIWVLKSADRGDVFIGDEEGRLQLPEGYEKRVKNRGIVVNEWVPQMEILGHPSTGWFMSHCGWNSCLEGISMGVPIVAWPMHSDQPRNAFLLIEVLRTGILMRDWESQAELVISDSIEDVVRRMMTSEEGKQTKKRAEELGEAVRGSVAQGGAARLEMESFIAHITCRRCKF